MKVARKKGKIISGIAVFALCFGAVFLFVKGDVRETFASVEEKLEDTKIMQTVEKVTTEPTAEEKKVTEKEQEIKDRNDEIKKQLEKNQTERKQLEKELEKDRALKKNVDEAKRRLAELEKEYEDSLEKSSATAGLDKIENQGHSDTESSSE